jgi:hypothetical protein
MACRQGIVWLSLDITELEIRAPAGTRRSLLEAFLEFAGSSAGSKNRRNSGTGCVRTSNDVSYHADDHIVGCESGRVLNVECQPTSTRSFVDYSIL